jgi:hypothetical protein
LILLTWRSCSAPSRRLQHHLHAEALQDLEHGVVARLGAGREGLVEALAAEAAARGDAGDAAGLGDLADRGEEDIRVAVLERGGEMAENPDN